MTLAPALSPAMRGRNGVYFLANDGASELAAAFLNSFRAHNPELPLCLVPFDEDVSAILRHRKEYRFTVYGDRRMLQRCDAISRRFHGVALGHYRKLVAWEGPFAEWIYIDLDTVVLAPIDFVFGFLDSFDVVTATSHGPTHERWVWKRSIQSTGRLSAAQRAYAANTGFIASRRGILTVKGAEEKAEAALNLVPHMNLACQEQAFLNYLIVTSGVRFSSLSAIVAGGSQYPVKIEHWAGTSGCAVRDGALSPLRGRPAALFVHWAGEWKPRFWEGLARPILRWLRMTPRWWPSSVRLLLPYRALWSHYRWLRSGTSGSTARLPADARRDLPRWRSTPSGVGAHFAGVPPAAGKRALVTEDARALYRAQPLVRFPLGGGSELAYFPWLRRAIEVSPLEADTLECWNRFEPLSEATERFLRSNRFRARTDVLTGDLAATADTGVLIGRENLTAPIAQRSPSFSPAISWVAIPTRGRPQVLKRTLDGYASNCLAARRRGFLVVGDDDDAAAAAATESALAGTHSGTTLLYAGRRERSRYVDALSAGRALPRDVVAFGLSGDGYRGPSTTIGAVRNSILLGSIGTRVLCVDDDTMCQVVHARRTVSGHLVVGGSADPTRVSSYDRRRDTLPPVDSGAPDPTGEHEHILGAPLAEVVARFRKGTIDWDEASPVILQALTGGSGVVRVTMNGSAGHFSETALSLQSPIPSHPEAGSESACCRSLTSRQIVRQARSMTLTLCDEIVGPFLGLDGSVPLPPFLPRHENAERPFGLLLSRCLAGAVSCHLPWALPHTAAARPPDASAGIWCVADVVAAAIGSWPSTVSQTPGRRLARLGEHLCELAALPTSDLVSVASDWLTERVIQLISMRERALIERSGRPVYWANAVRGQIRTLVAALREPGRVITPTDLGGAPEEFPAMLRALLRAFGELLSWWPAIMERAAELDRSGVALGRPIA